jgi:DNA polymerase-3 subunit delta
VESELGKIRAFCGPRRTGKTDTVTEEMVGAMFSSASVDTFACLNAVEAGNLAAVWREVARNGGDEGLFFMLQSMLDKRFRTMWDMLVDDSLQGVQPYALQLLRPLAARLGLEGVAQGLAVIEDAELKLKSGAWQGSQVLDSFLVTMTLLCGQCLRPDGTVRDRPSADRQGSVGPASREGGRGGM